MNLGEELLGAGHDDDDDFMFNDASTHWVICVYKDMFYYLK